MKSPYMKTLMFLLALGTCLGAALFLSSPAQSEVKASSNETPSNELIAGYQKWTKVNPEPKYVGSRIAGLCAAPTLQMQQMEDSNPHLGKFVVVLRKRHWSRSDDGAEASPFSAGLDHRERKARNSSEHFT
jgi:hypothetical protein